MPTSAMWAPWKEMACGRRSAPAYSTSFSSQAMCEDGSHCNLAARPRSWHEHRPATEPSVSLRWRCGRLAGRLQFRLTPFAYA